MKIFNEKVDVAKVSSKVGSTDNIHHTPGGGNVSNQSYIFKIKCTVPVKTETYYNECLIWFVTIYKLVLYVVVLTCMFV